MKSSHLFLAAALLLAPASGRATEPAVKEPAPVENPVLARSRNAMVLTLLGTAGGPLARPDRAQPANLLLVDGSAYLIDAGEGTVRQLAKAGVTTGDLRAVFITHLHTDHTAGIPGLLMFRWSYLMAGMPLPALRLVGPPGTAEMTDGAVGFATWPTETLRAQAPKTPPVAAVAAAVNALPGVIYQDDKIKVTAVENTHYDAVALKEGPQGRHLSFSYRVDSRFGSVTFTGDTGPGKAVSDLARGSDLLVSEIIDIPPMARFVARAASLPPGADKGIIAHMEREHLSPDAVARIARDAGVKKVVLSHIANPDLDPVQTEALGTGVSKGFDGPVVVGRDLLTLTVGAEAAPAP
ncbi:MBL fold metallo-hydrolase [Niveispirillum sp.]|uniref:MBL fold metallo-hydrolase n=1 Tax=Niveispirillum sp. TaxID=1917217 RepID=UPI001B507C53|nr:MBL fold metallo-hydrolase [Niveispirillum sp.]MBP7335953.1 MBL fold metallo-hydrolase [Niveispirillum sp.]